MSSKLSNAAKAVKKAAQSKKKAKAKKAAAMVGKTISKAMQEIMRNKIVLSNALSSLTLGFYKSAGNTGIRHFIRENFEALKYHNPNIVFKKFKFTDLNPGNPFVVIEMVDGAQTHLDVTNTRSEAILAGIQETIKKLEPTVDKNYVNYFNAHKFVRATRGAATTSKAEE